MMRVLLILLSLFLTASAFGQFPIFEPDDFVDPRSTSGRVVFISRLVVGAARGYTDQYRPAEQDVGYVHVANTLYWSGFQFDYEHSEVRGADDWGSRIPKPPPPRRDGGQEGISPSFGVPTEPRAFALNGETVDPAPRDVVQAAWYLPAGNRLLFRMQASYGRQYSIPELLDGEILAAEDHDETRGAQLDAGVRIGSRMLHGSVSVTELTRPSRVEETRQRTVTASVFLPLVRVGPLILTPRLYAGRVTSNTATDMNVINPSLDLSLYVAAARTNLHLVYSPVFQELTGSRVKGRTTHHQIAVFVDRALIVAAFGGD